MINSPDLEKEQMLQLIEGVRASHYGDLDMLAKSASFDDGRQPFLAGQILDQVAGVGGLYKCNCPTIAVRTVDAKRSILVMAMNVYAGDQWHRDAPIYLQAEIGSMAASDLLKIIREKPQLFFWAYRSIVNKPVGLGPEPKINNGNNLLIYPPVKNGESFSDYCYRCHLKTGSFKPKIEEYVVDFDPVKILTSV